MKKYRLNNENRQVFLNGLQQYKNQGVSILVDGEKAEAAQWEKVLEEYEDGSFYMGDYIWEDEPALLGEGKHDRQDPPDKLRENPEEYKPCRKLVQIRFDRVYHR